MRMAHEDNRSLGIVETELGRQRGQHVLPDGITRAAVEQVRSGSGSARRELSEPGPLIPRQLVGRPPCHDCGALGEHVGRDQADGSEVVVAGQADRGALTNQVDAGTRVRPVPDQVTEAPDLVGAGRFNRLEDGLECLDVGVDV